MSIFQRWFLIVSISSVMALQTLLIIICLDAQVHFSAWGQTGHLGVCGVCFHILVAELNLSVIVRHNSFVPETIHW